MFAEVYTKLVSLKAEIVCQGLIDDIATVALLRIQYTSLASGRKEKTVWSRQVAGWSSRSFASILSVLTIIYIIQAYIYSRIHVQ